MKFTVIFAWWKEIAVLLPLPKYVFLVKHLPHHRSPFRRSNRQWWMWRGRDLELRAFCQDCGKRCYVSFIWIWNVSLEVLFLGFNVVPWETQTLKWDTGCSTYSDTGQVPHLLWPSVFPSVKPACKRHHFTDWWWQHSIHFLLYTSPFPF